MDRILYRPKVVAYLFGLREETIRVMCREGRIPCVNLGSPTSPRWRIPLSFLEEAMRGEARWRYPKAFKRQCITKNAARNRLAQAEKEIAALKRREKLWSEEDEDGE